MKNQESRIEMESKWKDFEIAWVGVACLIWVMWVSGSLGVMGALEIRERSSGLTGWWRMKIGCE